MMAMIKDGVPIKIKVSGDVQNGSLQFELRDPNSQAVWSSGMIKTGDFSISTEYNLSNAQTGTYTLGLVYSDNISATYNLSWQAIKLSPIILLPGIGMILVALAFVFYAARRKLLGWRYLILGAVFWVITVIAKFAFAIPVNPLVSRLLHVTSDTLFSPGNLIFLFLCRRINRHFRSWIGISNSAENPLGQSLLGPGAGIWDRIWSN